MLGGAGSKPGNVRRQKTDPRDAGHILELLLTGRFPRIRVPSMEESDLRQLLVHRMKMVRRRIICIRIIPIACDMG